MNFKIPFTFSDLEVLKRRSKYFVRFASKKETELSEHLKNSSQNIDKREYLAICYRNFLLNLLFFSVIFTSVFGVFKIGHFFAFGLGIAFLIAGFILFNQYNSPKIYSLEKTRDIERNLISVMQDMLVQLNSGVPVFRIIVNIANSDYGEVSKEFKKIVAEINAGIPQIEAIEKYGKLNTSRYFRRVLWQISNGMRAGSDMSLVIGEEIKNLGQEQTIQILSYGSKLNPLIMFYMILAVILPSLGITFLIIISSMLNVSETMIKLLLGTIFFFILFTQIMFLGVIKSRRPSLL